MTVKDLVLLYESSTESPTSLDTHGTTDQEQQAKLSTHIQREVSIQLPLPTPARFIKRSEARLTVSPSTRKEEPSCTTQHPLSTTHLTTSHDYGRELLLETNTSLQEPNNIVTTPRVSRLKNSRSSLPNPINTFTSDNQPSEHESLAQLIYPPSFASNSAPLLKAKSPYLISDGYNFPLHKPVPAQTIFARNACALSLPKLDEYLALLPPPVIIRDRSETMFMPMEKLAKANLSLDDLENNSIVPPFWRDRSLIFGRLLSYLLAILVCK